MSKFQDIYKKLDELERFLLQDVPHIVGVEAQSHFQESFQKQGFTDSALQKWPEVKEKSYVVVREMQDGEFHFYSIVDKMKKGS